MSVDLNDNFLIHNIATKNYYEYSKLQKNLDIADMKHFFVFIHNLYLFYVKTRVNNEITIQMILNQNFLNFPKNIVVDDGEKSIISLRIMFESGLIVSAFKNLFLLHDASF
jgi:hypothetical protein